MLLAATLDDALISYGPLGIGVLVLGYFAAKQVVFLRERGDKAEAQRDALIEDVFTKVMPALARNTEIIEKRIQTEREHAELDREMIEALKATNDTLARLGTQVPQARRRT